MGVLIGCLLLRGGVVLPDSDDERVVDRRNASEWVHPVAHLDALPDRPVDGRLAGTTPGDADD
jgi:hypothetical protein